MGTQTQAQQYHRLYADVEHGSPEYKNVIRAFGRNLSRRVVTRILDAHGFTVADLLTDSGDPIVSGDELPETLDAALLFAWLGY